MRVTTEDRLPTRSTNCQPAVLAHGATLGAVRKGRIVVVSEAIDHPSPRLLDAIEQLARALHPERFRAGDASMGGGKN